MLWCMALHTSIVRLSGQPCRCVQRIEGCPVCQLFLPVAYMHLITRLYIFREKACLLLLATA
jgi:hypothetical protein